MNVLIIILFLAIVFLGVVVAASHARQNRQFEREVRELFARARPPDQGVVTEDMLRGLPAPVRRYLAASGVVGKPPVSAVRLKQTGRIRQGPEKKWMDIDAREYYTVEPPGFIWVGRMKMAGLPLVTVRDRYADAAGNMLIRMGYVHTMADARGPELDQGAMMRFLQEMVWFPSAFLGKNISWKAIDDASAEVTFTDGGTSVTGVMHFDADGRMANFVAPRYRTVPTGYDMETWSTPMTEYGELGGLQLPVAGQGVWNLASGDFAYIDVRVTELEYDRPEPY